MRLSISIRFLHQCTIKLYKNVSILPADALLLQTDELLLSRDLRVGTITPSPGVTGVSGKASDDHPKYDENVEDPRGTVEYVCSTWNAGSSKRVRTETL